MCKQEKEDLDKLVQVSPSLSGQYCYVALGEGEGVRGVWSLG